jgi:hypothetical protein
VTVLAGTEDVPCGLQDEVTASVARKRASNARLDGDRSRVDDCELAILNLGAPNREKAPADPSAKRVEQELCPKAPPRASLSHAENSWLAIDFGQVS